MFDGAQEVMGHLSLMQQCQIMQALTVLSNYFTDPVERVNFLKAAICQALAYFQSPQVTQLVFCRRFGCLCI